MIQKAEGTLMTTTKPDPELVPKEITEALQELDARKAFLVSLCDAVLTARDCAMKFPDFFLSKKPKVDAFERPHWTAIMMFGKASTINELQPILKFFADAGYRQSAPARDVPELSMRAWFCGEITIGVILGIIDQDPDGKRCHYVKVGKKTVPIYELKCED